MSGFPVVGHLEQEHNMAASCTLLRRILAPIFVQHRVVTTSIRGLSNGDKNQGNRATAFDEKLLEILVCPLTKKPLRLVSLN